MIKSSRNQIGNSRNSFQGDSKRVLCVCSAGLLRSPTMANLLHREYGFNTRACGSCEAFALIPISEALVEWADEIVFVNKENFIEAGIPEHQKHKCIVLDIEDSFEYGNLDLEQMIRDQYKNG